MMGSVSNIRQVLAYQLADETTFVRAKRWQGMDVSKIPMADMIELPMVTFTFEMFTEDLDHWRHDTQANLPWVDDHFAERVCGWPINPGKEWANWPWAKHADKFRDQEKFNHNYMERYWPKYANRGAFHRQHQVPPENPGMTTGIGHYRATEGINGPYGDLNDVVQLLQDDPGTRQAYLPMFYPEDNAHNDRKPCSLGYQFLVRDGRMSVFYPMRSCDFVRHFSDDIYLTIRLTLWVLEELRKRDRKYWGEVTLGHFTFHATSLHCFASDQAKIKKEYGV